MTKAKLNSSPSCPISYPEFYRECGYLRRHFCISRNAILSVTLTAIFAGGWILLDQNLGLLKKTFIFLFCACLYTIAYTSSRYYSKRIQLMTIKMTAIEKNEMNVLVHSDLSKLANEGTYRLDIFDVCVIAIGFFAITLCVTYFFEVYNFFQNMQFAVPTSGSGSST